MSLNENKTRVADRVPGDAAGLIPLWQPTAEAIERSNIMAAMRRRSFASYDELYRWSSERPAEFWADVLSRLSIRFHQQPRQILSDDAAQAVEGIWFPASKLNIAESCFQADPNAIAVLYGEQSGELVRVTYAELERDARRVASSLQRMDFRPGDAVGLFTPMNARSVSIYLGVILAGCVVVSIADSLSREQIQLRLRIGQAKAVFTEGFLERGGRVIPLFERIRDCGLPTVLADDDLPDGVAARPDLFTWGEFLGDEASATVAYADPTAPTSIIFSSGTTGEPKAIPWDQTTPIKAASDGHFHHDIHPSDVVAWPTNFGWMMGAWLTFATLINRGTIALFKGTPTGREFGDFITRANVSILGVVPSLVARWRELTCMEGLDWSAIRLFSTTGECSNAADMLYLSQLAGGKPVIEYCGGTEIGGGYLASTVVQPNFAAAFSTPTLGTRLTLMDEDQRPADVGEVFLVHPALGMSQRLLNANHHVAYYADLPQGTNGEVLRRHGDLLERLANGYYRVSGRADDAMNLGGIKVGSAELERVVADHADIGETAMIGVAPREGGPTRLVVCIGITPDQAPDKAELKTRLQRIISDKLCPLFKIDDLYFCGPLPRTASNKVMRRELRSMYEKDCGDDSKL